MKIKVDIFHESMQTLEGIEAVPRVQADIEVSVEELDHMRKYHGEFDTYEIFMNMIRKISGIVSRKVQID